VGASKAATAASKAASRAAGAAVVAAAVAAEAARHPREGTAFETACLEGRTDVMEALVGRGCIDVDHSSREDGATPLVVACSDGAIAVATKLVRMGADVNRPERDCGNTPLHACCVAHHANLERLVDMLVDAGADVDAPNLFGQTPLYTAHLFDNVHVTKVLLRRGAIVDVIL
jgi:ankyrin repeat protein